MTLPRKVLLEHPIFVLSGRPFVDKPQSVLWAFAQSYACPSMPIWTNAVILIV